MVGKRAYRRIDVKEIDRNQLVEAALAYGSTGTVLGLDIAKNEIFACVRWGQGCFERPWKIVNTGEIGLLIELCLLLKSKCDGFSVGLESTGTYGSSFRTNRGTDRKSIEIEHDVRTSFVAASQGNFLGESEMIVFGMLPIHEVHGFVWPPNCDLHGHTVTQELVGA